MFNQLLCSCWQLNIIVIRKKRELYHPKEEKNSELQAKGDHLSLKLDTLTTELLALYGKHG